MKTSILHIGKTGGTALVAAMGEQIKQRKDLELHGHAMTLETLWKKNPNRHVIFGVREPLSRFVSGFNSRLREGKPRRHDPWMPAEKVAFTLFPDPNALAEALSSSEQWIRGAAELSMLSIRHVRNSLQSSIKSAEFLRGNEEKIRFVYTQETLSEDFEVIKRILALPSELKLPDDDTGAHRTPSGMSKYLSDTAQDNLRKWYADDLALHEYCMDLRARLLADMGRNN
jgi:hypothetical protein